MLFNKKIITQGHRGARGLLPENTLESFRYALEAGVDVVEVDVNLTSDDIPILFHDETTNTDLIRHDNHWISYTIPWRSLNFSELQAFDVGKIRPGSDYAARFKQQQSIDGAHIPTLRELAELLRDTKNPATGINLEVKCSPFAKEPRPDPLHFSSVLLTEIHQLGISGRVTIQSFNWEIVAAVKHLDSDIKAGCLSDERPGMDTVMRYSDNVSPWTCGLRARDFGFSVPKMVKAMGVDYWSSEYHGLGQDSINEAHELGLDVHCWTVNDADHIKRLISWSVDSIISDYPDMLMATVNEYG